jgi:hypothetical protein
MQVLEVLIKNPSFSNPAKQTLLSNLNKLSFDQSKAALLRMLNDRGELKA